MNWPSLSRDDLTAIAVGGIAGAALRWLITRTQTDGDWFEYAPNTSVALAYEPSIPFETLLVNLIGCLLLGGLTLLLSHKTARVSRRLLVGAATGFCGSLTTFSTFAVEAADLLRSSERGVAVTYVGLSIAGGGLAFWIGRFAAQRILDTPGVSRIGAVE